MGKKLAITAKPKRNAETADSWVGAGDTPAPAAKPKRLTLDLDPALHTRIKAACAMEGTKMAERIRDMLEAEFPATP